MKNEVEGDRKGVVGLTWERGELGRKGVRKKDIEVGQGARKNLSNKLCLLQCWQNLVVLLQLRNAAGK